MSSLPAAITTPTAASGISTAAATSTPSQNGRRLGVAGAAWRRFLRLLLPRLLDAPLGHGGGA